MQTGWLLIVFEVRRLRIVRDLELRASKKPRQFYRRYDLADKDLLDEHIARLKKAGLHGVAKKLKRPYDARSPSGGGTFAPRSPPNNVVPLDPAQRAEIKRQAALAARSAAHVQSVLKRARGDA